MNENFEEDNKSEIRFSKQKLYRLNSNSILGILNLIKNLLYFLLKRRNTDELPEVVISFRWRSDSGHFKSLIEKKKEKELKLKSFFEERFKVDESEEKVTVKEIEKEKTKKRKVSDVENRTVYPNRSKEFPDKEPKVVVTTSKVITEDCTETITKITEIELKTDPESIVTQSNDFSFNNGLICPYCIENITSAKANRETLREYEKTLTNTEKIAFKEKYKILHHKTMIEHYNKSVDQINMELKDKRDEFKIDVLAKTANYMRLTNQQPIIREVEPRLTQYNEFIPCDVGETSDQDGSVDSGIDFDFF
jgi:preprotein translocase subunit SecD